jgi:hypothetical protein
MQTICGILHYCRAFNLHVSPGKYSIALSPLIIRISNTPLPIGCEELQVHMKIRQKTGGF